MRTTHRYSFMSKLTAGPLCAIASVTGENILHNVSVDVGQSKIATLVTVAKLFVINAHQVHDRCVKVVDVDFVANDVVAERIGFAVNDAWLDAGARHPH